MAEHENIYQNEAERYHALVSFEDYEQNLSKILTSLILPGQTILESGSGTGRVTDMLFHHASDLVSFDLSFPMLSYARRRSHSEVSAFRGFACSDHRFLPVAKTTFDIVISGWSVCYLATWQKDDWVESVHQALREFLRVLRPEGLIILIETLGTGKTSPEPPLHMVEYIKLLEKAGFLRQWIRTDYHFPDMETARELTNFFFGRAMIESIENTLDPVLPECTGIWTCKASELTTYLRG